jgi:hypothetical protein
MINATLQPAIAATHKTDLTGCAVAYTVTKKEAPYVYRQVRA